MKKALCLLALAGCTVDAGPDPETATTTAELTQSPLTTAHPAAVAIYIWTDNSHYVQCSASVLSRHWILTAAHCVHGMADGLRVEVDTGSEHLYDGPAHYIPYEYYDAWQESIGDVDTDDDVGLVHLDGAGMTNMTEQAGIWGNGIAVGDTVNVIGFGWGSDPGSTEWCGDPEASISFKRIQDYALHSVSDEALGFDYGDSHVCPGDSGGPWFPTFENRLLVVGVTSNTTEWLNNADGPRVDEKLDWIEGKLAGTASCSKFLGGTTHYTECFEAAQHAIDLDAGARHACAVLVDGRVRCWGDNASGQLGIGTTVDATLPRTVNLTGATRVATGTSHSCAVAGGQVSCWGSNASGQLGNPNLPTGAGAFAATPQPVLLADGTRLSNVREVSAGGSHTCAVTTGNNVYCWGDNTYGQLGNDATASSTTPVLVGQFQALQNQNTFIIAKTFVPLADIRQLDVGNRHACAIDGSGAAYCWGYNAWGQLGNNTTTTSRVPVKLSLGSVARISAGYGHTCAVYGSLHDHAACWGMNALGQLGTGDGVNKLVPTAVATGLSGSLEVGTGKYHTCFTGNDRQRCAGDNGRGQLGAPALQVYYSFVDSAIETDTNVPAGGDQFTCTRQDSGTVACSGANSDGQLANGATQDVHFFWNARDLHHIGA